MNFGLRYQPEPLLALQARLPKALEHLYHLEDFATGKETVPMGMKREHVFDFDNGIRIIAAYEEEDGEKFVHFSFSQNPQARLQIPITYGVAIEFANKLAKRALVTNGDERTPKALHLYFDPAIFGL